MEIVGVKTIFAISEIHIKIWVIEKLTKVINDYDKVILCGNYADYFSTSHRTFQIYESH